MPRVSSIIVFKPISIQILVYTFEKAHLTYDTIRFVSIRDSFLASHQNSTINVNIVRCVLGISRTYTLFFFVQSTHHNAIHLHIHISNFAYAPIFALANSPNEINTSNIFQIETTKKKHHHHRQQKQHWMHHRVKKNQPRVENENENMNRTELVGWLLLFFAWFSLARAPIIAIASFFILFFWKSVNIVFDLM